MIGSHFSKNRCAACLAEEPQLRATVLAGFGVVYVCADPAACRKRYTKAEVSKWG